jgi:hypothetical protein
LTVTARQQEVAYEVEVEICDMDWLSKFNQIDLRSIVRRYLQNVAALTHLMKEIPREIEYQKEQL